MCFIKLDFTVATPVEHVWNFGLQAERIPEWQFDVVAVQTTVDTYMDSYCIGGLYYFPNINCKT